MQNKILVVGPAWIGDMMMAQSLFQVLKQQQPHRQLHVLAPAWSELLLKRMIEVDYIISSPFHHGQLNLKNRYQLAKQLQANKYDQAIILPNSFKSALIPFWAKIPKRTGWIGEQRWGLLNDIRRLDKKKLPKMVERFTALALNKDQLLPKNIPFPRLTIQQSDIVHALKKHQISSIKSPILALCPGAEFGPSKQWPAAYFAEVAEKKYSEGWAVWLLGSANDRKIAEDICKKATGCVNLVGTTTLAEAVDLLSLSDAVVANDSGLMHIAAALEKPIVALYGSTSFDFTPPLSNHAKIITSPIDCRPCFERHCPLKHHRCMKDILPRQVLDSLSD